LIQSKHQTIVRDSIVACRQSAADFFDNIGPTENCRDVCGNGRCLGMSGRNDITSKTTHVTLS
jgi:hypothetical protein